MTKIGYIQLWDDLNHFHDRKLSKLFDSKNVDWRYVYWPHHISYYPRIFQDNFGKSYEYNRFASRFKDVTWEDYNIEGDPIIKQGQVDDDTWDHYYARNKRKSEEYMDYHEIRIINDPWASCAVNKRVEQTLEWVRDCDFILVDIAVYMYKPMESKGDALQSILNELEECNMKYLLYDFVHIPSLPFLYRKSQKSWDDLLENVKRGYSGIYVSSEEIEAYLLEKNISLKNTFDDILHVFSDYHQEIVLNMLSKEIAELSREKNNKSYKAKK